MKVSNKIIAEKYKLIALKPVALRVEYFMKYHWHSSILRDVIYLFLYKYKVCLLNFKSGPNTAE